MKTYTVYFLCDNNGKVFYIGCTQNYKLRIKEHLADSQRPRGVFAGAFMKHKKMVEIREAGGHITAEIFFETSDEQLAHSIEQALLTHWPQPITNWIGRPRHLRMQRPPTSGTPCTGDLWRAVEAERNNQLL